MGLPTLRLGTTQKARRAQGAPRGSRPVIPFGNANRAVPLLSGPVGPDSLRARYRVINAPADVALVDGCFAALVELQPTAAPNLLAVIRAVQNYGSDRAGAIAAFQRVEDIRDDAERNAGVILPDGLTWQTLFTYAELARDLDGARDRKVRPVDYVHIGGFDHRVFQAEAAQRFAASRVDGGRYNSGSVPAMLDLLGRCAADPRIIDIRWIAYILATVMWETNHPVTLPNPNGNGTRRVSRWASPAEEGGRGKINANDIRGYYLPVKVAATSGGATITEQDGNVFEVSTAGAIVRRSPGARLGSDGHAAMTDVYRRAAGTELRYYGRGYCQLTWWENYASTGVEIGLGLALLLNPERALEPAIAFEVMVHGMVYGLGFAHGNRMQKYFIGGTTDYVGARAMVNGVNENVRIARVAEVFEACLLAARR